MGFLWRVVMGGEGSTVFVCGHEDCAGESAIGAGFLHGFFEEGHGRWFAVYDALG